MKPKYKIGDVVFVKDIHNNKKALTIKYIEYDPHAEDYIYYNSSSSISQFVYERDIIDQVNDKEEYELYLKLKEKYGN